MADVKLTPRQTAQLLTQLDHGLKSIHEARQQLIVAMAERRASTSARKRQFPSARATTIKRR